MAIVWENLWLIIAAAIVITLLKAGVVWALFRVTCAHSSDALRAGSVLTGAGEFAFVLLPLGVSLGILNATQGSLLSAIAAITLLIGPPFATLTELLLRRLARRDQRAADDFDGAIGSVLVIGFGRFGQIVSQYLLAEHEAPRLRSGNAGFSETCVIASSRAAHSRPRASLAAVVLVESVPVATASRGW